MALFCTANYYHYMVLFFLKLYFRFLIILHRDFSLDLRWRRKMMISIIYIYIFAVSVSWFFSYLSDSNLLKRWAVLQSALIIMSYRLELTAIFLIYLSYLPTPPLGQDMTQGQLVFKRSLTGLNSEFFLLLD